MRRTRQAQRWLAKAFLKRTLQQHRVNKMLGLRVIIDRGFVIAEANNPAGGTICG